MSRNFWLRAPTLPPIKRYSKFIFIYFKKIWRKPGVANSISHERAKYQLKKLCILNYTKMTRCGSKYAYFQISKFYQILLFVLINMPIYTTKLTRNLLSNMLCVQNNINSSMCNVVLKYDACIIYHWCSQNQIRSNNFSIPNIWACTCS